MPNRAFYAVPVVVAGLASGIPSSLCCCFALLTAVAALFAVYLVRRRNGGQPIEPGEGAIIGGLVGTFAAIVAVALQVVIRLSLERYVTSFQAQMGGGGMQQWSISSGQGAVGMLIGGVLSLIGHIALGVLGGALSTLILKTGAGSAPQNPF